MFSTVQVGKAIRQARMAKNMTQTALADELGVSYQAVSNWERGSSMPDIAKLPDLCRILNVSFEELMGAGEEARIVRKAVEEPDIPLTIRELTQVAPILPPKKLEEDAKANMDGEGETERVGLADLLKLAPFLEEDYLDQLALEAPAEDLDGLTGLAPFLSDEALDTLARRLSGQVESLDRLAGLAPFLPEETLGALLDSYQGSPDGITGLAPFAPEDALDRFVIRSLQSGKTNIKELTGLLPFLSDAATRAIADHLVGKGDLGGLSKLFPFL